MKTLHRQPIPFPVTLGIGLLLLACMFIAAMTLGAADTSLKDVWTALVSKDAPDHLSIIRELRLPREIAAAFVGAALAVSGAVMQGITRNPLADPGLLGLTAGAGAALAVMLTVFPGAGTFWIMIASLVGAALGSLLVFGIGSMKRGGFSPFRIVLAGAAISAFLYAVTDGIGLYFNISKDVSMWTAGGLIGTTWDQLRIIVPFITAGVLLALLLAKQVTILSLNEEVAAGLGQNIRAVKLALFGIIILLAGASVALVGNLVFIGLMVPHLVRPLVGTDYRFVLPMSAIAGAAFMLLADTIGRTINAPFETPVVAIIAMMGIPFFLIIVRKGGNAFS
ncbi:iron ABC transporter permease [Xylanibacillus composti]|uniref:Ferrichrome ABC transporter permease n=1 Tax=Xylanibacillus composti TaxID=1572762 RepID=A0A8J4H409_9BACL|nr:iron ABC transporter permease [Xylanibacillus composti]MDT9724898.1 iron ABC transporter permease [Xylanibacillus composti]GIQ68133.1 ferrichrome ABC transporter permease [Xylanibacillus composti]